MPSPDLRVVAHRRHPAKAARHLPAKESPPRAAELHWSDAMSLTTFTADGRSEAAPPRQGPARETPQIPPRTKVTISCLLEKKVRRLPISAVTVYDYASARLADETGIDVALVGDSLAMVMLGHENTLAVTVDEMLVFTRGARKGVKNALLVADLPYGSYHLSDLDGVANALRFVKDAGAEAVKLEGGKTRETLVKRLVDAEIPVMGHIGLTPQSLHRMGGFKVQAKSLQAIDLLRKDAAALVAAGCFSLVVEGVPREVAARVTEEVPVPVIGIGAGPDTDGQVLVLHDLLGMTFAPAAKFARRYADVSTVIRGALTEYRHDVEARVFPSDEESYHLPRELRESLGG